MHYPTTITATWDGVVVAACAALAPLFFISEGFSLMNFGYSKFAGLKDRSTLIPGKIGMFALYFPAALVFPFAAIVTGFGTSSWPATATAFHWTIAAMVTFHFFKRCLEVQYLHKFSSHTNLISCVTIASLYLLTAFMFFFVAAYRLSPPVSVASAEREHFAPNFSIGITVWLCGISGNFYHHLLLSKLRGAGDVSYAAAPLHCCTVSACVFVTS
jgi:very-long-chain enoyl-CoA reductase